MATRLVYPFLFLCFLWSLPPGCTPEDRAIRAEGRVRIVFKHGKIAGDPEWFRKLLDRFEEKNPGIRVIEETLPASTDEQHQFYGINLEGRSRDFDLLSMDVIWVPEFSRAGWIRDLTDLCPEEEQSKFFPATVEANTYRGRLYGVPWYIDAGVLYYRKDLLDRYGFSPPKTWAELVKIAQTILRRERDPQLRGFIWQGKQYEGLVCNVLEYVWGNGGAVLDRENRVVIDHPPAEEALAFMRDLIDRYQITPDFVTTATEEPTRHIFGNGQAVFLRNWPYAWNLFQREGSKVKGQVGIAPLPGFQAGQGAATLGGWQLGINRFSEHPEEAGRLIQFLTSEEAQRSLALQVGYKPTRMALYQDQALREAQPFVEALYPIFLQARPRPVTPYYVMISQILQAEFSAILAGVKEPGAALQSAKRKIEYILQLE
ncbi:MAG: ABC transporter substrate-binding protein [Candidatus Tectomicrobia bacterium]|uniref:ABC transporter substrate-binding protein n=1 Tax=Tectimicrobiota bacterium TaxID=2528274 RepID=A0A932FVN5_UNCTE|nr:ABC transporter substrate-binding protein [Candidatus Tectomicrobia bacterium]